MDAAEVLKIFRKIAPEFEKVEDRLIKEQADIFGDFLSKKRFGQFYTRAVAYFIAHQMKLNAMAAESGTDSGALTAGNVTMEKEGDLQRQYADNGISSADSLLRKTVYGRQYLAIRAMCIVPLMMRMG